MSDEIKVNGTCHCSQIEIEAVVQKSEVRACHCTDCQKMSGAPLRAIAVAPADKIKIKGITKKVRILLVNYSFLYLQRRFFY